MEVLREPPNASSFIPLAEHQSRTPESFHSEPPILHHQSEKCKIVILERDLANLPALAGLRPSQAAAGSANGATVGQDDSEIVIDGVDIWVVSERLLIYSLAAAAGVAIPYPSILLHAIQRLQLPGSSEEAVQGLYMQLASATSSNDDMDGDMEEDSVSLTIVPQSPQPVTSTTAAQATETGDTIVADEDKPAETPTEALFAAVSACSNLHPDPAEDENEDEGEDDQFPNQMGPSTLLQRGLVLPGNISGGLPPPLPGSGGWITAENAHEYFDEEGNWKGGEDASLGAGAGIVRPRSDEGNEGGGDNNGRDENNGEGGEETKWRRTE